MDLEAILTSDEYDAARAEPYGWITCAVADAELDDLVYGVASRIASFDKAAVLGQGTNQPGHPPAPRRPARLVG